MRNQTKGRTRLASAAVITILALGLVFLFTITPVHAASPSPSNNCGTGGQSLTESCTVTVAAQGDTILVIGESLYTGSNNAITGALLAIPQTNTSATFNRVAENGGGAPSAGYGYCNPSGGCFDSAIFSAIAPSAGHMTVTVGFQPGVGGTLITGAGNVAGLSLQVLDVPGISLVPLSVSGQYCATIAPCYNAGTATAVSSLVTTGATLAVAGLDTGFSSSGFNAIASFTLVGASSFNGVTEWSNTVASPTSFGFTRIAGPPVTYYNLVAAGFGLSAPQTSTTVINTNCLGACSGGQNGTSTTFSTSMPQLFVFYSSQNGGSQGQIDNVTLKVASVHMTTNSGNAYVAVYSSGTTLPSGGNPYVLISPVSTITLTNSTSNFFIHVNPQINICANCYYAVGFMSGTTASRGSGATGSGVKLYETSQVGVTNFEFNPGQLTPPSQFFSSTVHFPNFFMYIHETFTVATVTSTTTTTLSGNVTSTFSTTVTSTATTIDSTFFLQNANYPLIMFVLLIPAGLFLGVTKTLDGAIVGLMIGAIILIVLIPELRWIFTGLVIAIVALAMVIHRRG